MVKNNNMSGALNSAQNMSGRVKHLANFNDGFPDIKIHKLISSYSLSGQVVLSKMLAGLTTVKSAP